MCPFVTETCCPVLSSSATEPDSLGAVQGSPALYPIRRVYGVAAPKVPCMPTEVIQYSVGIYEGTDQSRQACPSTDFYKVSF